MWYDHIQSETHMRLMMWTSWDPGPMTSHVTWSMINVRPSVDWFTRKVNSLASGKFEWNFRYLIFQIISVIDGWGISCELALRWMSLDLTDDKSTLVQVMAWCRQATSQYLIQYWPRSLLPYGVTGPKWVNSLAPGGCSRNFKLIIFK